MSTTLLSGIGLLATQDEALGEIADAALVMDGEHVVWVGSAASRATVARKVSSLAARVALTVVRIPPAV